MADKRGVLLLVWVHGFRGGDDTFASFPSRIVDTLASLRPNLAVKALVYPAYDTRGFLVDAVAHFVDWLVEQAVLAQTEHGVSPTLVLCAHSMGGMVIADAVAQLQRSPTPWPTILGVIAYDTPFRGLNPAVFKNKLEHAVGIASQGQAALSALGVGWGLLSAMKGQKATPTPSPPASSSKSKPAESTTVATNGAGPASTSWLGSYGIAAGAGVALAAVAGAAFYQKDVLSGHLSWATSHLSYVAELWKTDELEARLNRLEALDQKLSLDGADGEKRPRIKFHCFYTTLPPNASSSSRTFIVLPPSRSFTPNLNTLAKDEVQAHVDMFEDKSDGIYALGKDTVQLLMRWLDEGPGAG